MTQESIQEGEGSVNKNSKTTIETIAKSKPLINTMAKSNRSYSAAVPISLYREVAAELQFAKTKLSALSDENGRLKQQNQLLRREIQHLFRSTPIKKSVSHSFIIEPQKPEDRVVRERLAERELPPMLVEDSPTAIPDLPEMEKLVAKAETPLGTTEIGQNFPVSTLSPKAALARSQRGMNGWMLALAIILIVGTAFAAGFLLVRPLIDESGNRK